MSVSLRKEIDAFKAEAIVLLEPHPANPMILHSKGTRAQQQNRFANNSCCARWGEGVPRVGGGIRSTTAPRVPKKTRLKECFTFLPPALKMCSFSSLFQKGQQNTESSSTSMCPPTVRTLLELCSLMKMCH